MYAVLGPMIQHIKKYILEEKHCKISQCLTNQFGRLCLCRHTNQKYIHTCQNLERLNCKIFISSSCQKNGYNFGPTSKYNCKKNECT